MKDESPVEAVERVLNRWFGIKDPRPLAVMDIIDAVQQALPPHPDATIASLRAILRDLKPHNGLDSWATRCAEEITRWMARQAEIREVAKAYGEGFWCHIEGVLAGMLMRVTRGLDLEEKNESTSKD